MVYLNQQAGALEDTKEWIRALHKCADGEIMLDISPTDVVAHFKCIKESKAFSPPGRHIGHYKSIAKKEVTILQEIITLIVTITL